MKTTNSATMPGRSALINIASATAAAAAIAPNLEPFEVPLATIVRAPAAFANTDAAAFQPPPPGPPAFVPPPLVPVPPGTVEFTLTVGTAFTTLGSPTAFFADLGTTDLTSDSFAWEFGDGATSDAAPPLSHTYAADGLYTASLTLTRPDGAQGMATVNVVVDSAVFL
jgi:hypothetical protein